MRQWFKPMWAVMAAAVLILCPALPAYGAESSVIENVSVTFKTAFGEPEEIPVPEITVSGKGCTLGDVQYKTDYDRWKPGRKVRIEVTVLADDGKYFPVSLNRSQCKVSGAAYVSAKSLDSSTLQVKVDYKPVTVLGDTQKAGWSSSSGKRAVWKPVEYAPGYSVVLYGDDKVVKRLTVENNNVDLGPYMKDIDKTYYYEVKAVPVTSEDRKCFKEGNYVTSTDQEYDWGEDNGASPGGAGDGGDFRGDNYIMPDGSRAVNTWKKTGGRWYYFDGNGNRVKGWLNLAGTWYYMDQNGVMCTGWLNLNNGDWFYLGPSGNMLTGWVQDGPGAWYYMNQDGYMQRGWVSIDGKWYYLNQDGRMATGWLQDKDKWYYLMSDGQMAVNTVIDGYSIGADGVANR